MQVNRLGSRFWNLFLESTRWRRRLFSGNKIKTISWHWWSTEWLCHFVVKLRPKQSQKYEHRNWNTNKFFTGYKHRLQNSKWKTDFTMELIKWKDQPQSKERILFLVKPFISLAFILNSNVSNQRYIVHPWFSFRRLSKCRFIKIKIWSCCFCL